MSIVFDWLNPNESELTKIEVYRADKRGGPKTLLATVKPTDLAYEDLTADVNKVYWYSTIAYMGDDKTASVENPLASFEKTGPGSQKLLRGDWGFGYFGSVGLSELPSFAEIASKTRLGTASGATVQNLRLHKFIANGKIIFIPTCPLTTTTFSVSQLRSAKVFPQNGQPDKELARMTKGDFSYFIRVPFMDDRGSAPADGVFQYTGNKLTGYPDSLFSSELIALHSMFWDSNRNANYLPSFPWMADEELIGTTYFGSYVWSGTNVKSGDDTTNTFSMFRGYDLMVTATSGAGFSRLFWPIYVLDMES